MGTGEDALLPAILGAWNSTPLHARQERISSQHNRMGDGAGVAGAHFVNDP
jgi:hypothetical protein